MWDNDLNFGSLESSAWNGLLLLGSLERFTLVFSSILHLVYARCGGKERLSLFVPGEITHFNSGTTFVSCFSFLFCLYFLQLCFCITLCFFSYCGRLHIERSPWVLMAWYQPSLFPSFHVVAEWSNHFLEAKEVCVVSKAFP